LVYDPSGALYGVRSTGPINVILTSRLSFTNDKIEALDCLESGCRRQCNDCLSRLCLQFTRILQLSVPQRDLGEFADGKGKVGVHV
jgi:hypothetical protein